MKWFSLIQQVNIEEKMKNAPDKNYEIGVVIGTFLPFLVLIGIAYLLYYRAKKKKRAIKLSFLLYFSGFKPTRNTQSFSFNR